MRRALVVGVLALSSACIDFDAKLDAGSGRTDAGGPDASAGDDCPGFTNAGGWCWVNPTPMGEDLLSVLYRADDDVWVGGAAGTVMHGTRTDAGDRSWEHRKLTANLAFAYDRTAKVYGFLDRGPEGVWAYGEAMQVMKWTGSGWEVALQTTGWVYAAAQESVSGKVVGVGTRRDLNGNDHDYSFDWSGGVVRESPLDAGLGRSSAAVAVAAGFVTAHTDVATGLHTVGGAALGTISLTGIPNNVGSDVALWAGPSGSLWAGGDDCSLAAVSTGGAVTPRRPCVVPSGRGFSVLSGSWSPSLGKHVVIGSRGMLFEATEAELATPQVSASAFETVVPSAAPRLNAVALLPDAGGLVVGDGAYLARRGIDQKWRADQVLLRSELRGAVSLTDGGTWFVGDDGVVIAPPLGGDTPTFVAGARSMPSKANQFSGAWFDGTTFVTVGVNEASRGQVFVGIPPLPVQELQGTELRAVGGPSSDSLVAVGTNGVSAVRQANGSWAGRQHDAGAGTVTDLNAILSTEGGVLVAAHLTEADGGYSGALYSVGPSGLGLVNSTLVGLNALSVAGGVLFAAGDYGRVLRLPLDGGSSELLSAACAQCRLPSLSGVFARSPTDVWVAGGDGVVAHFNGTAWEPIETGTRRRLNGVTVTADANGHHWLWLYGEYGTILRKQLD